jgi:Stress responsive A/B Barrel Domain
LRAAPTSARRAWRAATHAFTADFADAGARDAYLADPHHQAAGAQLVAMTAGGVKGLAVIDIALPA